jgi:hypothetical protein
MTKWLVLLAGPLIWSAHLGFVYAAATLEITLTGKAGLASRIAVAVATLVCLAAIGWIGWSLHRRSFPRWKPPRSDLSGLWRTSGALLCLIAFMAVLWQGLPAILIPERPVSHDALP